MCVICGSGPFKAFQLCVLSTAQANKNHHGRLRCCSCPSGLRAVRPTPAGLAPDYLGPRDCACWRPKGRGGPCPASPDKQSSRNVSNEVSPYAEEWMTPEIGRGPRTTPCFAQMAASELRRLFEAGGTAVRRTCSSASEPKAPVTTRLRSTSRGTPRPRGCVQPVNCVYGVESHAVKSCSWPGLTVAKLQ